MIKKWQIWHPVKIQDCLLIYHVQKQSQSCWALPVLWANNLPGAAVRKSLRCGNVAAAAGLTHTISHRVGFHSIFFYFFFKSLLDVGEDVTFNLRSRPQLSLMWSGEIESESLAARATEAWPPRVLLTVTQTTTVPSCWRAQSAPQAHHTALRAQSVSDQLSVSSSVLVPNYPNSYAQVLQWGTKPFWIISLIYRDCSTNLL